MATTSEVSAAVVDFAQQLVEWDGLGYELTGSLDVDDWVKKGVWDDPLGAHEFHVRIYALASAQIMQTLGLVVQDPPMFAPEILARSCLESAAACHWLTTADSTKEIIRRTLIDRVWSQEERVKLLRSVPAVGELQGASSTADALKEAAEIEERSSLLVEHGRDCGLLTEKENPRGSRNISAMSDAAVAASTLGNSIAPVAYGLLSGVSHVNPLAVLSQGKTVPSSQEGTGQFVLLARDKQGLQSSLLLALGACEAMVTGLVISTGKTIDPEPLQRAYTTVLDLESPPTG